MKVSKYSGYNILNFKVVSVSVKTGSARKMYNMYNFSLNKFEYNMYNFSLNRFEYCISICPPSYQVNTISHIHIFKPYNQQTRKSITSFPKGHNTVNAYTHTHTVSISRLSEIHLYNSIALKFAMKSPSQSTYQFKRYY